jgi:tight adherence protein C
VIILLALSMNEIAPILVFSAFMLISWRLMVYISDSNNAAEDRLERIGRLGRPDSEMLAPENRQRFTALKDAMSSIGGAMEPKNEKELGQIRQTLIHAGFRSEQAPSVFFGIRLVCLIFCSMLAFGAYKAYGLGMMGTGMVCMSLAAGMFGPAFFLNVIKSGRQKQIFLTLPDALDLLVVCVESGLGLDAAMRKVTDEMKDHAKTITDEFAMANMQLQMGRARRDVLHDLGMRTGVDDMRSLAAILIQADRFGASIAQALRVQSDAMRTRRRQIAEEKAAKTAVQLIFPLVLFIFPAIFVVLVGPAAIQISQGLMKG